MALSRAPQLFLCLPSIPRVLLSPSPAVLWEASFICEPTSLDCQATVRQPEALPSPTPSALSRAAACPANGTRFSVVGTTTRRKVKHMRRPGAPFLGFFARSGPLARHPTQPSARGLAQPPCWSNNLVRMPHLCFFCKVGRMGFANTLRATIFIRHSGGQPGPNQQTGAPSKLRLVRGF